MTSESQSFSSENEADRLALFRQVSMQGLRFDTNRFGTFIGVMPLSVPDGIRILVYSDTQCHHPGVMNGVFDFADWWRPHMAVHVGDFMENWWLSLHSPNAYAPSPSSPQDEVESVAANLRMIMARGNPFATFVIHGNHDSSRVTNYVSKIAPIMARFLGKDRESLMNLASRMGFEPEERISFINGVGLKGGVEGGLLVNGLTKFHHGKRVRPRPGDSAWAHFLQNFMSNAIGHVHRLGHTAVQTHSGVAIELVESGCLIDWRRPEYAYQPEHNWHHGFVVVTCHNGVIYMQPIPIIEGLDETGQVHKFFVYLDEQGVPKIFKCYDN